MTGGQEITGDLGRGQGLQAPGETGFYSQGRKKPLRQKRWSDSPVSLS